ncbi:MAG TPA: MFS transporter [Acidimicrobiales bacterium]|nr:MFS transporter [Acidimicrobiales bacterium]
MSDEVPLTHLDREDPDGLLNARSDPASAAFGTLGSEAGSDLNWFLLLRQRVQTKAESSSRYPWWVLWSLLAGLFALNFTFTVFIVALPTVATQFHTSVTVLTWTMVGPLLAYGLAAPMLGKTGDIYGHRRLYLFGLLGAMVSAVLTALSHNVDMLLFARTLDGVQGAATGTASGALINMVFSREERVKAMGWWSLVGAGGPVIGVSLGSPIIAAFGWRSLFWFQLVLIVVAFAVVVTVLPRRRGLDEEEAEKKARARQEFKQMDWIGSWSLSIAVTMVMLGLSVGPSLGWTSPWTLGMFVLSAGMTWMFIYRLHHAEHPLIPAYYFRRRNFVMPMILRAAANFAYFGAFFLFPLLMEQGYNYSIPRVGALAIARPLTFAICSPIAGYVAIRVGERVSAVAGAAFLAASMCLFALLEPSSGAWVVAIALALSGLGMGVAMPSSSSVMANEVKVSEFGVMSAAQLLAMQVGEVAGIQVLETVQQSIARRRGLSHAHHGPALLSTFHTSFIIGACVAGVGLVAATFMRAIPRDRTKKSFKISQ